MTTDTEAAWYEAWKPFRPPAVDYLMPSRRSLFDAGRDVGLEQGFAECHRVLTGVYPAPGQNPYEKELA